MENQIKSAVTLTRMDEKSRVIHYEIRNQVSEYNKDFKNKYIPQKGDKLWFFPGCAIPRFKLKHFCTIHGTALVKYADKATAKFIGKESINEMTSDFYGYVIPKEEFLKWFETIMCNAYIHIKADILSSSSEYVYLTSSITNSFEDKELFGSSKISRDLINNRFKYGISYIKPDKLELFTSMLQDNSNIYHQDDLLGLLNVGTVMTQSMYEDIHKLFKSTDKENTRLAMEAMANCDFQKSAVYLLLILREHGTAIYNSGNRHHVNFKSLLKYFNISNITNISVDQMIDALRHQQLLNLDNLNRLMPLAMEVIRKEGDMENIRIKDVELSPEAELSIAENILDGQETLDQESESHTGILDSAPGAFT